MIDSFAALKEFILTGNIPSDLSFEASHQRLINAINARKMRSPADIACLVRHALRREDQLLGGETFIKVPRTFPYPDREIWQKSGIKIVSEGSDYYLVSARAWQPEWLDLADQYPPEASAFKETIRRNYDPVPGDPFLNLVGLKNYRSAAQREAIRAVLTAPKNSTLVINLPTGSGKSLCAQLPALIQSQKAGVSVVVVPTTALALDQERALQPYINYPTAYYGDDSELGFARRKEMQNRIRQGTQRIIFTSPESLIDSLAPSLYEATKQGLLHYFVIDEAHMVEQWGDGFRPAFQQLPGLRTDLLRLSSFNTLLLTATLTASCLDTLETLFGQPDGFQVISAVQLRPEPAYWFAWCENEEIRTQRLLEAVYHLPRPLIIYASKREDVARWRSELSAAGFKRFATMTGKSTTPERSQLIQDWRDRKIDIVVATSAFGLGVDQADVRAVIHVCIPETIDRFYQEVGRGGRDGNAALSLTLHTNEDRIIAKSLNKKSTITIERGLQRWESMFYRKQLIADDKFIIPTNTPPSQRQGDIDMDSEENQNWNIRTLTLMVRADLIQLDWKKPPVRSNFYSQASYFQALEEHRNHRVISVTNEQHLSKSTWETQVESVRFQRQLWSDHNLKLMLDALRTNPRRCLSELFAEAYTIPHEDAPFLRKSISVSRTCGGCAFCRKHKVTPFSGIMPLPIPVWQNPDFFIGEKLNHLFLRDSLILVFYDVLEQSKWELQRNELFKWLIIQGITNVVSSKEQQKIFPQEDSTIVFWFDIDNYQSIKMPRVPTLIFYSQEDTFSCNHLINKNEQVPTIILLPVTTPDPNRCDRSLIDIFPGRSFYFESFCTKVGI